MRVFHAESFTIALPAGHRFPISKYRRLHDALASAAPAWLELETAPAVDRELLERSHAPAYVEKIYAGSLSADELRMLGFPWSPALLERSRRSVGATIAALAAARADGVAASLAGGTHHAGFARGAGFCVFNDVATATHNALAEHPAARVLVIDCDVHQGDGTAEMLACEPRAYTFSIHSARNYPHRKALSDLDIGLPDGADDAHYLRELDTGLAHAFRCARPQMVLYIAGADVYKGDRLGRLAMSSAGIAERDRRVLLASERHGAALAMVMGGGYAADIDDTVAIQRRSVELAGESWQRRRERRSARISQ